MREREQAVITMCPDGPLLVRGPVRFENENGEVVDSERNVVALCRCGRSARKPLCDGTHRRSRFRAPTTDSLNGRSPGSGHQRVPDHDVGDR